MALLPDDDTILYVCELEQDHTRPEPNSRKQPPHSEVVSETTLENHF